MTSMPRFSPAQPASSDRPVSSDRPNSAPGSSDPGMPAASTSAADDRSMLADIMAFTPSTTLGRELLALVLNLALVGLTIVILQPRPLVSVVLLAAVGLYMLGRLAAGFRTRGYGRSLTGER